VGIFLNIERLDVGGELDIVNIQSFVYVVAFFAVFSTLVIPEKYRPSIIITLGAWWLIYFVLKLEIFYAHPILGGYYTYLTITELAMLSLLILSSNRVSVDLYDVEDTIANVTLEDVSERVQRLDQAEDDIAKEFARSRRYDSPISVMVVKVNSDDVEFKLQRTAEEIMQGMLKRYATNKLVRLLDRELRRTDLVLEKPSDDQVVLVLPETSTLGTDILSDRIREVAKDQLGLSISTGFASFPDEALTFDDLLNQAENQSDVLQVEGRAEDIDQVSEVIG
jgi:hypothetical protein